MPAPQSSRSGPLGWTWFCLATNLGTTDFFHAQARAHWTRDRGTGARHVPHRGGVARGCQARTLVCSSCLSSAILAESAAFGQAWLQSDIVDSFGWKGSNLYAWVLSMPHRFEAPASYLKSTSVTWATLGTGASQVTPSSESRSGNALQEARARPCFCKCARPACFSAGAAMPRCFPPKYRKAPGCMFTTPAASESRERFPLPASPNAKAPSKQRGKLQGVDFSVFQLYVAKGKHGCAVFPMQSPTTS